MNSDDQDWMRPLAGVADALLVFFPALALARAISLPLIARSDELVSATTRAGFEPLTNYVQFAVCAIVVWVAFFLGYRRGRPTIAWIPELAAKVGSMSRATRAVLWTLAAAAAVVYLINVASFTLGGPIEDGFHEGEYLGFVPAVAAGKDVLRSTFSTHGPGVDLLPGWLSSRFGNPENGIVATRLAYAMLRTSTVVASLLVVLAFARLLSPASSTARWIAESALAFMLLVLALQIGAWTTVPVYNKSANARDLVYLLQVLLVLLFARVRSSERHPTLALLIASVAGVSLPWGIIYSYDRGLYGVALLLLASIAFRVCAANWARTWLSGLAVGAAIGGALLYAALGAEGIGAVLDQVSFWVRYGRALFSSLGILALPDTLSGGLLLGAFIALALAAARIGRAVAMTSTLSGAMRSEIGIVVLSAASLLSLRVVIERGDVGHVALGAMASWIMLSVLVARFAADTLRAAPGAGRFPGANADPGLASPMVMIGVSALIGCSLSYFGPFAAYDHVRSQCDALRTSDAQILSAEQTNAVGAVHDELRSSSCFYTLTNEGAWYYLVHKPSCSRFYEVTNARPIWAQREVVAALQATSPAVILFSNGAWSNSLDGISTFNANPEVVGYVLRHYVPFTLSGDNWFWKRSGEALRFSDRTVGKAADVPAEVTRAWDLRLGGTYGGDLSTPLPKALFVTDGSENTPIWAGRPGKEEYGQGQWSALVPTAILVPGAHRLRVWAFHGPGIPLLQLGGDIDTRIM